MKIEHKNNPYGSNVKNVFDKSYDYWLFRQDWGGSEIVYFNNNEIEKVMDKVFNGELLIHNNYSILYCKDESLLNSFPQEYVFCYMTIYNETNN